MRIRTKLGAAGVATHHCHRGHYRLGSMDLVGHRLGYRADRRRQPVENLGRSVRVGPIPGADKAVTVNITNPNPYPVIVTGISGSSSRSQNGCAAASVYSDGQADATGLVQDDGSTNVVAPTSSAVYRLATHMVDDPSDACKLQTFQLDLTASLQFAAS